MKHNILLVVLLIGLTLLIVNCKPTQEGGKDAKNDDSTKEEILNEPKDLIGQTYKVVMFQEKDARYAINEKQPTVTFNEGDRISIRLSVNSCNGTYEASASTISIESDGCTEACCDTDIERMMMNMFRGTNFNYELTSDDLRIFNADYTLRLIKGK